MLFVGAMEFIYENIFMNILILVLFIWFCIWAYKKSVKSRKYFICPNCKESFRSEHMSSKCCKVCGAQLVLKEDNNVNDKAGDEDD